MITCLIVMTIIAFLVEASPNKEGKCDVNDSSQWCALGGNTGSSEWAAKAEAAARAADNWGDAEAAARAAKAAAASRATARASKAAAFVADEESSLSQLSLVDDVVRRKAKELRETGIVYLPVGAGGMASAEVVQLRKVVMDFFDKSVENIQKEMQKDPTLVIRFSDCVARRSHRLDLKPPKLWDPEVSFLHQGSTFHEIMKLAFQNETMHIKHCGALVARPMVEGWTNNVNQSWHRDTEDVPKLSRKWSPFGISVYIQLIKMTEDNGVTEFLRSSQTTFPNDVEDNHRKYRSRILSTAGMQAGDIVLFDVRTLHRGMLHTKASQGQGPLGVRPVVQLNFGVEDWVDKAPNWGARPLVATPKRGHVPKNHIDDDPMEVSLADYLKNNVDEAHLNQQKLDQKRKKELKRLASSGFV